MKKFLFILILIALVSFSYANDTFFFMAGGQLYPSDAANLEVEMQEEIITVTLEKDYYQVAVAFYFYNHGKTTNMEVSFPFFYVGLGGDGEICDFETWTNGKSASFKDFPIAKDWQNNTELKLEKAYVRNINFPSNQITETRISYKSKYGITAPSYSIATYLYGTGETWKNSIGKITFRIVNNLPFRYPNQIYKADVSVADKFYRKSDNTFEAVFYNVEPEKFNETFIIFVGDILDNDGPMRLSKNSFFGCKGIIPQRKLFWYTKEQLRLVRNAIYAFHGYEFKAADLKDYFESIGHEWNPKYAVNKKFSESEFSKDELYNIKMISKEEQNRLK